MEAGSQYRQRTSARGWNLNKIINLEILRLASALTLILFLISILNQFNRSQETPVKEDPVDSKIILLLQLTNMQTICSFKS
jgi:hypothetical protein